MPFSEYDMPPKEAALRDAIHDFMEACRKHDEAHAGCDNSWGYYGLPFEKARNEAWDKVIAAAKALGVPH